MKCNLCEMNITDMGQNHATDCPDLGKSLVKPRELTPLEIIEKRYESYPLVSLNTQDLLLLDIARSLRELIVLSHAGLEFSKGLGALMVDDTKGRS